MVANRRFVPGMDQQLFVRFQDIDEKKDFIETNVDPQLWKKEVLRNEIQLQDISKAILNNLRESRFSHLAVVRNPLRVPP